MAEITMPQLGETVTEGTITRWYKQVGDRVEEDEALFEVSTDKVDSEVPSPAAGFLTEILVPEGETVDVGARLAVIGDAPSSDGDAPAAQPEATAPEAPPAAEAPAPEPEPEPAPAPAAEAPAPEPAPAPAPAAEAPPAPPAPEPAPAPAEETTPAAPAAAAPAPAPAASDGDGDGTSRLLSPVVRRLITENGLDPATIKGTGAGGRITRSDVLSVIEGGGAGTDAPTPAPAQQPAAAAADYAAAPAPAAPSAPAAPARPAAAATPPATAGERDERIPFSNIRRRTAEHMVRSKATSAHTLIVVEVDFDAVDKVRTAQGARFRDEEGFALTYLPFVSRAVVDAIEEFPIVNSSVGDDELIVHRDLNLGIAVDLNFEGLMAPVIQGADGKRLRAIAREISDLARRARSRRLRPDDIAGGTFTITNAGPFGTLITGAIINQPQVAILATDGVKKKPVVVQTPDGGDAIAIHPVGNIALTWDHRAFDGAYAAAFTSRVREILETRDWAAEL